MIPPTLTLPYYFNKKYIDLEYNFPSKRKIVYIKSGRN